MTATLSLQNIDQYYGGSHILRDLSLEVPLGKVTVVLGRNGVGKSTLLKCIAGLTPVKGGKVVLDGQDVTRLPSYLRTHAGIAYVPQGREIFSRLTVHENLLMGMASKSTATPIPHETVQLFPILEQMAKRRGGDLSGGQQQQLAIARALVSQPKLLLLDEPTEGIQPNIIKDIGRVIRMLASRGNMAIVLVEQYYDFAASLADHYVVMQRGQIIAKGLGPNMERDGVRDLVAI